MFLSVFINLFILFLFKYYGFFTSITNTILNIFKIQVVLPSFDLLLLVGISFYTFQALSYTIDVYRCNILFIKRGIKTTKSKSSSC